MTLLLRRRQDVVEVFCPKDSAQHARSFARKDGNVKSKGSVRSPTVREGSIIIGGLADARASDTSPLPFALCLCYAPRRVRLITKHEFRIKIARALREPGHQLRQLVGVAAPPVATRVRWARARRD